MSPIRPIKNFIKAFDFPNPTWEDLPVGFPNLSKEGLTKEEKCLLDAIVVAWKTGTSTGRKRLYCQFTKSVTFLIISLISLIGLISLILSPQQEFLLKPVNAAATVSAALKKVPSFENLIESTMSAITKN